MSPALPPSPESLDLPADAVVALTSEDELVLHRLVRKDPPELDAFVSKLGPGHYTVWGEAEDICERAIVHHES